MQIEKDPGIPRQGDDEIQKGIFGNFSTQAHSTEIYGKSFNGNTIFVEETTTPYVSGLETIPTVSPVETTILTTDQKSLLETTPVDVPEGTIVTTGDKIPILTTTMKPVSVTSLPDTNILTSEFSTSFKTSITTEESFYKPTFSTGFTSIENVTVTPPTDGYLFACNVQQCANTSLCLFNFTKVR